METKYLEYTKEAAQLNYMFSESLEVLQRTITQQTITSLLVMFLVPNLPHIESHGTL